MVENIIGFSFVIKLVKDGKDFQIDRVVVQGTNYNAAEAEAKMRMYKLARKRPDEMVVTHWEPIYSKS